MIGRRKGTGFTLMEIIMVIGIFAVLALAAIPFLSICDDRHSELEGARIKTIINHAQSLAMTRKDTFRVAFDTATEKITLTRMAGAVVVVDPDNYTWDLEKGDITSADFGGNSYLEFNAKGKNPEKGTVVICYGKVQQTIDVTRVTGHIQITEVML